MKMKHIKSFEKIITNTNISVGDWVALKTNLKYIDIYEYLLNIPCEVVETIKNEYFTLKDNNEKGDLYYFNVNIDDIDFVADCKEDIEIYLTVRKYNL